MKRRKRNKIVFLRNTRQIYALTHTHLYAIAQSGNRLIAGSIPAVATFISCYLFQIRNFRVYAG